MAAITQVQQGSATWEEKRDRAIALAGRVADVWDVVIAWGAGVATWVLYLCLILNIVELFWAPALLANGVLVVQSITLDIAGLGLGSMASHAERSGHEKTAKLAKNMSRWLISLMVITVALISAKQIQALQFTFVYITWAETVLVLVRVITTVFYGHVVKSIREVNVNSLNIQPAQNAASLNVQPVQPPIQPVHIEEIDRLTEEVNRLSALMVQMSQTVNVYISQAGTQRQIDSNIQREQQVYTPIDTPVQRALNEPATVTISEIEDTPTGSTQATTEPPQAQIAIYPQVEGIAADVVKLVVDEHLTGTGWTAISAKLGKNYSRVVKPIRDAYTQTSTPAQQK